MPHDSMRIFSEKVMFLEISTSSDRPVPLKEVQNIRVRSELLPPGRRIRDLLESMERREQGMTSPTLLDSL